MSTFERYDETAPHYDRTRVAVGADIIRDALHPAAQTTLLDAGCGTGAYAAALAGAVGRLVALDRSAGMLATARRKLAGAADRVGFLQGDLLSLPLPDAALDAVMFNQVLHHLEDGRDPGYPGHRAALAEAARVVRPGGRLVLNACSHEQLRRGFWFYGLIPKALERTLARCAPTEVIEGHLDQLGFDLEARRVPADAVLQGDAYFDPRGPLDPDWRRGDSIWALADAEETAAAVAGLRRLDKTGELDDFLKERDEARRNLGQVTFFLARRR